MAGQPRTRPRRLRQMARQRDGDAPVDNAVGASLSFAVRWQLRHCQLLKVKGQSAGAQFKQATKLVVKDSWLASYRVVSTRSCIAWFLQYSVLGELKSQTGY